MKRFWHIFTGVAVALVLLAAGVMGLYERDQGPVAQGHEWVYGLELSQADHVRQLGHAVESRGPKEQWGATARVGKNDREPDMGAGADGALVLAQQVARGHLEFLMGLAGARRCDGAPAVEPILCAYQTGLWAAVACRNAASDEPAVG